MSQIYCNVFIGRDARVRLMPITEDRHAIVIDEACIFLDCDRARAERVEAALREAISGVTPIPTLESAIAADTPEAGGLDHTEPSLSEEWACPNCGESGGEPRDAHFSYIDGSDADGNRGHTVDERLEGCSLCIK